MNYTKYPYNSNSWTIIDSSKAEKRIDKSAMEKETGIPIDIRWFFEIEEMEKGERRDTELLYGGMIYKAYFKMSREDTMRSKLIWGMDFAKVLREAFPDAYQVLYSNSHPSELEAPILGLEKIDSKEYKVYLKGIKNVELYIEQEPIKYKTSESYKDAFDIELAKAKNDTSEARKKRLSKATKKPQKATTHATIFIRNADVVAEVLSRAKGYCEKCGKPAPFKKAFDGSPYLEVHHNTPLSLGGDDTVENAVALCPNCHRELHFGKKSSLTE